MSCFAIVIGTQDCMRGRHYIKNVIEHILVQNYIRESLLEFAYKLTSQISSKCLIPKAFNNQSVEILNNLHILMTVPCSSFLAFKQLVKMHCKDLLSRSFETFAELCFLSTAFLVIKVDHNQT